MKVKKFHIIFDNFNRVYYVGEKISGQVIIAIESDKKVRGIIVKIKGEAETKWTGAGASDGMIVPEPCGKYEKYFENKVLVFGGGNDHILEGGRIHIFKFSSVLPLNIPPSFKDEVCHIRYSAKAIIKRPWKFNCITIQTKAPFIVKRYPLNLNSNPQLAKKVNVSKEKTFGYLWWASGPLCASVSIQQGGFVPGQTLLANIQIENNSSVNISDIIFVFEKVSTYHSHHAIDTKNVWNKLSEKKLGSLRAHSSQNWTQVALSIPSFPQSDLIDLEHCKIIDIIYRARLTITPNGLHKKLNLRIPVVIGHIPLQQNFNRPSTA